MSYTLTMKGPETILTENSYGSMDEVKPLIVRPTTDEQQQKKEDAYPEASPEQKKLLLLMDRVMLGASGTQVCIPPLTKQEVETKRGAKAGSSLKRSLGGFLCSSLFGTPLLALISTISIATGVSVLVKDDTLLLQSLLLYALPGLSALIGSLGSFRPALSKVDNFSQEVWSYSDPTSAMKRLVNGGVEELIISVASNVDEVNMQLSLVVDDLKIQFQKAAERADELAKIDPSLSIPAIGNVEEELQSGKEDLRSSVLQLQKDMLSDVQPWMPSHLASCQAFRKHVSKKTLSGCLSLQLFSAYGVSLFVLQDYLALDAGAEISIMDPLPTLPLLWWVVVLSLQAYLVSFISIGIVFLSQTSASATKSTVNDLRMSFQKQTNQLLNQHGILFLCRDILELRMERVQSQIKEWIHQSYKLAMIWTILDHDLVRVGTSSSSPSRKNKNSYSSSTSPPGTPQKKWSFSSSWKTATTTPTKGGGSETPSTVGSPSSMNSSMGTNADPASPSLEDSPPDNMNTTRWSGTFKSWRGATSQ